MIAKMFLGSSRIPDAAQLESYFRALGPAPTQFLQAAIDRAVRENPSSFAPAASLILAAASKEESTARKQWAQSIQQSRASAAGGEE